MAATLRWLVFVGALAGLAACGPSAECTGPDDCPAGHACYFGSCVPPARDGGESDGTGPDDARPDIPADGEADEAASVDTPPEVPADGEAGEDAPPEDAPPDVPAESEADPDVPPEDAPLETDVVLDVDVLPEAIEAIEEVLPLCSGAWIGGHCWYAGAVGASCDTACAAHGGCDLAGTRDYAGSGGTDAQCVAVLAALGFGSYPHQDWSNNDLGCHFAWGSWTYWSTAFPTTCASSASGASAVRMCACLE